MLKNIDINVFQPKGNSDIMHYVTCNKSSLFAPRLNALEKQGKDKYPWQAINFVEHSWSERH